MKEIKVGRDHVAMVDDADYDLVSRYRWNRRKSNRSRTIYAFTNVDMHGNPLTTYQAKHQESKDVYMHKLITGFDQTDHINNDGLDNQRTNLREATASQNQANTFKQRGSYSSQFKGVSWDKRKKKWRACIKVYGKYKHIGHFIDEVEAAKAYDRAAIEGYGEFARPNFE